MKRLTYIGPRIVLWDGRLIEGPCEIEVADESAADLIEREPDLWSVTAGGAPGEE